MAPGVWTQAVLGALGNAARTAREIAAETGASGADVALALDHLARVRRVAWRDLQLEGGAVETVWWAVPVAMPEAWWRALGDDAGVLAA